eukprot:6491013-Amphidinium_carterae.2
MLSPRAKPRVRKTRGRGKGKGGKDAKGKGKKGACYVCGSPDHMQSQCPKGKGKGGKGKGKDDKGKAQCHKCWGYGHYAANCPSQSLNSFGEGAEQPRGGDTWWWWPATDEQQWWATQAAGVGGTLATPGAGQAAQTLGSLNLNTLSIEGLVLSSFSSSVLKLKKDEKTGRTYFTASGEKVYDKGVQHVRGTVKGATTPIDVRLRVADVREGLLSVLEIVDKGFKVVFDKDGSYAEHKTSGERLAIACKTGTEWRTSPASSGGSRSLWGSRTCVPRGRERGERQDRKGPWERLTEEGEQTGEQEVSVKVRRRPEEPTAAEVLRHSVLHEPYRSWCRICVAARGLNERHEKQNHTEDGVITIGMDYGYLLDGAETDGSMPLWCAKDTRRWFYGAIVPTKGAEHPYNVLEARVGEELRKEGVEVIMSEASKGDSSGNGLAEHAVREVKSKTRGLRLQVEEMQTITLVQTDAIVVWMVLLLR